MNHKTKHKKCVKYTLEDKAYTEYDSNGDVVYTKKLRHDKSVTFIVSESGSESEYDKWGRTTYDRYPSGYWCLKFYDEPTDSNRVNITPFQVVHKHWGQYN